MKSSSTRSQAAKKSWNTRKAKQKHKEIVQSLFNNPEFAEKVRVNKEYQDKIKITTEEISEINKKYTGIFNEINKSPNIMNALPIESVRDLNEFEKEGRPAKARVGDISNANQMREKALAIVEEQNKTISEARIAYIEMIQENIKFLLKD